MNSLIAARIAAARASLASPPRGDSDDSALVFPRHPGPPVAFFASLTPRTLMPRFDVAIDCELLVYPVTAGRSAIGCRSSHPDVTFRGVVMRSRFDGSGLEGHQWIVDAGADGVALTFETSTNGTRLIRDDEAALARLLARPYRFHEVMRDRIGEPIAPQTWCFLPLRDGDVLLTVHAAWIFARMACSP